MLGLALAGPDCVTKEGRNRLAEVTSEFTRRFRERVGALDCPDILGCDVRTAAGLEQARAQDLFATRCTPAVRIAAELLVDLLPPRATVPA